MIKILKWVRFWMIETANFDIQFSWDLTQFKAISCLPAFYFFSMFLNPSALFSVSETWKKQIFYTEQKKLPGGFIITELSFPSRFGDPIFRFHQLTYSSRRNFEELRMEGKVESGAEGKVLLVPKNCVVMAIGRSIRRWYPIRAFDCDHIVMEFSPGKSIPELRDYQDEILYFPIVLETKEGEISGVIVKQLEEGGVIGFSSQSRYVLKKAKVRLETQSRVWNDEILDGNDSLLKFSISGIPIGTKFFVSKKKATDSFLNF